MTSTRAEGSFLLCDGPANPRDAALRLRDGLRGRAALDLGPLEAASYKAREVAAPQRAHEERCIACQSLGLAGLRARLGGQEPAVVPRRASRKDQTQERRMGPRVATFCTTPAPNPA